MLRRDTHAASAPFSFAIAGTLLLVAIGTAMLATDQAGGDSSSSDQENLSQDADAILHRFAGSKGAGWDGGADGVHEIGLLNNNGSGIDLARIQTLKGALFSSTENGKLDYDDALRLLGIDPVTGGKFHLRVAPVGLQIVLTEDLSGIKTAYIADASSFSLGTTVALGSDEEMAAAARAHFEAKLDVATVNERKALVQLGLGYDDRIHVMDVGVKAGLSPLVGIPLKDAVTDDDLLVGDVFPDQKQYLDLVLSQRLDQYELLIIGSNVDHSSLTANHVKGKISTWVQGGGNLIVFGSASKSFQWLESTMGVGLETVNGGAFAPDVDHPILNEPHRLDWPAYNTFSQAWGGKSDKSSGGKSFDELFQHVIQDEDGDVLAISRDGAFGAGRVFLTSFRPTDITNNINLKESMGLINNIVVYSDRSYLMVDYGPAPPQDRPVGASSMTSHVWDEKFGQVPVRVVVLAWDM